MTDTILGIIIGAVITFLSPFLNSIIDRKKRKEEFEREMFKITHIRKIEVAEKTVSYYTNLIDKITAMTYAYRSVRELYDEPTDNGEKIFDFFRDGLEHNYTAISKLTSEKPQEVDTTQLYFDVGDIEARNNQEDLKFSKSMAMLNSITLRINNLSNEYAQILRTTDHNFSFAARKRQTILDLHSELKEATTDVIEGLELILINCSEIIARIRKGLHNSQATWF